MENCAKSLCSPPAGTEHLSVPANRPPSLVLYPTASFSRCSILVAGLATSGLLWLCYFPVAWGWLAWVALVPLLTLVRSSASPKRVYLYAWLSGLAFYWPVLQWMRVADDRMYATWAALATYCSLYAPLAVYLWRRLDRAGRVPLVVAVPVVWTGLEYLRAHLITGFPWYLLGHTQHAFLPAIQIADLGGAYAVTFLVAAVNALIFEVLCSRLRFRQACAFAEAAGHARRVLPLEMVFVFIVFAASLAYGTIRLNQEEFTPGPRVALVQGNLDQRFRNHAATEPEHYSRSMVDHYAVLTDQAAAQAAKPELIVWPETSYPDWWVETSPDQADAYSRELAATVARRWRTNVLLGLNAEVTGLDGFRRKFNSALLVGATGVIGGRYDKMHRVPFGEYVPLREWLPWMDVLAPYEFDYSIHVGERWTRFRLGEYRFAVLICYEDTDPLLARQYVLSCDGIPAVDFLVNISNDGWFDGTSEHEEHLAICRFRAVECRRAVARAVNMGISAVIDGSGRVVCLPGPTWDRSKKMAAVLTAEVPIDHRTSLYARWGDWLPWSCWLVLFGGIGWTFFQEARQPRLSAA